MWKSKLTGTRVTDERPAGVESYKKTHCGGVLPSVVTVQKVEMSVTTEAAEGEPVSLEIADSILKTCPHSCLHPSPVSVLG